MAVRSTHIPPLVWAFLQRWEGGGRFHEVAGDPGGATKWGISFRFIENLPVKDADINRDGVVNWRDVFDLEEHAALELYERYFWAPLRCHELNPVLSFALFDTAVNCGRSRAVRWLQHCAGAQVDGIIGPRTVEAAQVAPSVLACCVLNNRDRHYQRLVNADHARFGRFLAGWNNRTQALRQKIHCEMARGET